MAVDVDIIESRTKREGAGRRVQYSNIHLIRPDRGVIRLKGVIMTTSGGGELLLNSLILKQKRDEQVQNQTV
jgi:hypothetical protein